MRVGKGKRKERTDQTWGLGEYGFFWPFLPTISSGSLKIREGGELF